MRCSIGVPGSSGRSRLRSRRPGGPDQYPRSPRGGAGGWLGYEGSPVRLAARRGRRRRGRMGDTWHPDEVFVTIQGRQQYLWRAVDEDGDVLDILVQSHRNRRAAVRFFRTLRKKTQGRIPRRLIPDQLRSYAAACRTLMPSVVHVTDHYANNRAEISHQPTRQRERQMRRFTSAAHVQRFASVHGVVQNLFRVGRDLLRSRHHRVFRKRAFIEWDAATCAC